MIKSLENETAFYRELRVAGMTKGVLRFFFEYGAGGCLWAGNAETRERLGVGPVDAVLYDLKGRVWHEVRIVLPHEAVRLRDRLDFQHSGYLNPLYPPDPSLWTQALCERFNAGLDELVTMLRGDLGSDYEILDQQDRYSEDPGLAKYLARHPDLSAIDEVVTSTVR